MFSKATGGGSTAVSFHAASGFATTAVGLANEAGNTKATAIGNFNTATGIGSTAVGSDLRADY